MNYILTKKSRGVPEQLAQKTDTGRKKMVKLWAGDFEESAEPGSNGCERWGK